MNSKFLLSVSLFLSSWLAVNANSKLSFNAPNRTSLKVVINGKKFYSNNNSLAIRNLNPGAYTISIYTLRGNDFNDFYNNGNTNRWKRISTKQVNIRNSYLYDVTINRFGRVFYDQDYNYYTNNWGWGKRENSINENDDQDEVFTNEVDFDNGFDEDFNDWDFFKKPTQLSNPHTGIFNNNSMNAVNFNKLKETAQNQPFETSRLSFLKQQVSNKYLSNNQIIELAQLFNFENNKLEFLKHAYNSSNNKSQYFMVINSLTMQNSKDELMDYIKDKR